MKQGLMIENPPNAVQNRLNPVTEVKAKVVDLLNYCKDQARNKDIVIDQNLNLKQKSYGGKGTQIANQGNIQINILQQEVMLGLFDVVQMLSGLEEKINSLISSVSSISLDYTEGMNLRQYQEKISQVIVIRDYQLNGGSPRQVASRLGISKTTVIKYLRQEYGDGIIPKPGWPPGPRKKLIEYKEHYHETQV